jgi:DNA polymerase-1
MTKEVFGVEMGDFLTLLNKHGVDFFDEIPSDSQDALVYSAEDSDYALQHDDYWLEVAEQIPNYGTWLPQIEEPFGRVIGLMEYWGMFWDENLAAIKLEEAHSMQEAAAQEITQTAKNLFGLDINPGKTGKTGDVRAVIFDHMKVLPAKFGKDGPSLDEEAILDMVFMLENNLISVDEEKYLAAQLPPNHEELDPDKDPHLDKATRMAIRIHRREPHPYKDEAIKLLNLVQKIQTYSTLISSHIEGRGKYKHSVSGRIHAQYSPWTRTARLNCFNPNGQNVPRLDNDEFGIRNFYIPEPGKILFFIDFSGFELRLMAWRSGDETLIEIFTNNGDVHRTTAAEATGKPPEEVTKKERQDAKPVNFGVCYFATEVAIQKTFKTDYGMRKTREYCASLIAAVKRVYKRIPEYQRNVVLEAREKGWIDTIYGYIRLLPDINSTNSYARQQDERRSGNTPIQGSAADIMKKCQNEVYDKIGEGTAARATFYGSNPVMDDADQYELYNIEKDYPLQHGHTDMIAQIHDEIIFEVDDDPAVVEAVYNLVHGIMIQPPLPEFPLPIEAEASVGYAWGKKIPVEEWLKQKRGVA